ncbi:hypothetical protein PsYK624_124430 [Phanerochaete sordida]|uniref:Uncharacterized protein n=1 Tax=Phanerochaete sordida TaxID=48140 RepID=A0A9P3LJ20_9APHY|nr:hypothetical protein PsYK624_124430 [Phanerochaete sordida]
MKRLLEIHSRCGVLPWEETPTHGKHRNTSLLLARHAELSLRGVHILAPGVGKDDASLYSPRTAYLLPGN